MMRLLWLGILSVVTIGLPLAALAGPNEFGTLNVQGNVDGVDTAGDPCTAIALPQACEDLVNTAQADGGGVEWFVVVATHADGLAFNTITFGVGNYDTGTCYIGFFGPCIPAGKGALEIPSSEWPGPMEGTSVSWAPDCRQGTVIPVYYFGVYAYGDGSIPLADEYPGQDAAFVSCENPPVEDPIAGYGTLNCGNMAQTDPVCIPSPTERTTWGQIKNIYR